MIYTCKQVLWHAGCYAVCAAAFSVSQALMCAPLAVLSMLGMALVCSFNFMALHETVHRSAFKSRMWNDVVMHVAGFLTMRPALHYFYYHWAHHKFTGNPEMDSELIPSALDMDIRSWSAPLRPHTLVA
jgi:fatty acid desaturase